MTIMTGNNILNNVSEPEKELTLDFLLKESLEILSDEVDYFFSTKEQLVDYFIRGVDFKSLNPTSLEKNFHTVFRSEKDIEQLLAKIEKRIQKEINRTIFSVEFKFSELNSQKFAESEGFSIISDKLKTYKLSNSMVKLIDFAWKKTSAGILPKEAKKFSGRFKPGNSLLGYAGVSPTKIEESTKETIKKVILGTLKQNKLEIIYLLKREIIQNLVSLVEAELVQNTGSSKETTAHVQIA